MRSPVDSRPIGDPIGPTALLILSTAYVTRGGRGVGAIDPYFEIIAAPDHDPHAPRLLVHTRSESLYADALRVEGTDERIAIPRGDAFAWRRFWA